MPELGWTQTELANRLMVSRQTVSQLLHEEKAVTAEMAIRISSAVGGTPEGRLGMQQAVDLWDAGINLQSSAVLTRMQNHGGGVTQPVRALRSRLRGQSLGSCRLDQGRHVNRELTSANTNRFGDYRLGLIRL